MNASSQRLLVVTPTLGTSPWLHETVASVAALHLGALHVLAAPAAMHGALLARFPSVHVVPDAGRFGGIYGALNAALARGPGEWDWFTYINDDDRLLPGFGGVFREHASEESRTPVIYGDVELIDENGRVLSRVTTERDPAWIPALLQQGISPLQQQGMLFRRDFVRRLGGFDLRYRLCADLDFWLRAFVAGARFCHAGTRVAQFRLRPGQLSGATQTTQREQTEIVRRLLPDVVKRSRRFAARWRYRACNLPRYIARVRTRGFRTSYGLLERGEVQR